MLIFNEWSQSVYVNGSSRQKTKRNTCSNPCRWDRTGKELLDIYPSSGRTKDIARTYLNLKAKAIFKWGKKGKELNIKAEMIRSLYNIDYGDRGLSEKIVLSSSPKTPSIISKIQLKTIPVIPPKSSTGRKLIERRVKRY